MTAQELRIGNLVKINDKHPNIPYHNLHVEIIGIFLKEKGLVGSATVKQLHFTSGIWIDYLQPIPLTEEWLLKFGYNEEDLSQGKIIKGINGGYIITNLSNKEIFYVHKLQNIHYELKDKELTYNGK